MFYVFDENCSRGTPAALPDGGSLIRWQPTARRFIPRGATGLKWFVWAAFHYAGVFKTRDYSVIEISRDGAIVHRSGLFPKYWRFPFMRDSDLQIGDTWTEPHAQGRGLAVAALQAGIDVAQAKGVRLWYLTTRSNRPSIAVAERAGLRCAGAGLRRSRFGLRALGTFVLTAPHDARQTHQ